MTAVDVGLLLIRLVLGVTMLLHAWNHWFGGGRIDGTAGWFEGLGLRPGRVHAWSSVAAEVAAGAGLVLGLLTPFACAAVIGTMAVAGVVAHRRNGFFVFRDGYEYVLMIAVVGAAVSLTGPGRVSLDHALDILVRGGLGCAIAVGAGLGGTALLLATSWRPKPESPPVDG
ncbi:DoxX family protein [Peterkaempfera bronchialis]|uniref:DoxX family protein n=1 Tax=Peterkaempfera bronchialis TaxID=2126346 RepID=A0A345SRE6_9ACTN|nr:DoxX family protein [Peterkaempfera bronchialis]AXI76301.1 DoxX family protein [Peterkaempfera bronchialis]